MFINEYDEFRFGKIIEALQLLASRLAELQEFAVGYAARSQVTIDELTAIVSTLTEVATNQHKQIEELNTLLKKE